MSHAIAQLSSRVESLTHGNFKYRILHPTPPVAHFVVEAVVKVVTGVRYLRITHAQRPSLGGIFRDCLERGLFSPRPYVLGQAPDRSTASCIMSLCHDLCRRDHLELADLISSVFPADPVLEPTTTLREVLADAEWQGTRHPHSWTPDAVNALSLALQRYWEQHMGDNTHVAVRAS